MAIGKRTDNVFNLVHHFGNEEDQVSANFAFILRINKNFLLRFLNECLKLNVSKKDIKNIDIETQVVYSEKNSVVDIQITLGNKFFVIIESKIWNNKPQKKQLIKYAKVLKSKRVEGIYKNMRLVLITQLDENSLSEDIMSRIILDGMLNKDDFYYLRWMELKQLFEKSYSIGKEKFINELFMRYLGDKMADKKIIKEQRIKDVEEVLIKSTNPDWLEHVQKTKLVCLANNTPDAQYVAIYRTSPSSAITHIAKVVYTENNVLARLTCKDYPDIIQKGTEKGWIDNLHKVYHLEELIELPIPIRKEKGSRGVVRDKWFKNLTDILKAKTLSDLKK